MHRLRFTTALLVVLTACGSRRTTDVNLTPLPVGTYSFSGSAEGTVFNGMVTLLPDHVEVSSNLGACPAGPVPRSRAATQSIQRARRLEVSCGGLWLRLQWDAAGTISPTAPASVEVTRSEAVQGDCIRWVRNERGVMTCAGYDRVMRQARFRLQGTASVGRVG